MVRRECSDSAFEGTTHHSSEVRQQVLEAVAHMVFTVSKQSEMHADTQLTSSFFLSSTSTPFQVMVHIWWNIWWIFLLWLIQSPNSNRFISDVIPDPINLTININHHMCLYIDILLNHIWQQIANTGYKMSKPWKPYAKWYFKNSQISL